MSDVTIVIGTNLGPRALFAPKVSPGAMVWFYSSVQDVTVDSPGDVPFPRLILGLNRWSGYAIPAGTAPQSYPFQIGVGSDQIPLLLTVGSGESGEIGDVGFSVESAELGGLVVQTRMWAPVGPLAIDISNKSPVEAEVAVNGETRKILSGESIKIQPLTLSREGVPLSVGLVQLLGETGHGQETGGTTVIDIFAEPPPGP